MPADPGLALDQFLIRQPRPTAGFDELAGAYGETQRQQNPAMAAALAGTTDKRSREYRREIRRFQGARRGRVPKGTVDALRRIAAARMTAARVTQIRRRGLSMRLSASIKVSRVWKFHVMPADAGGRPQYWHLTGGQLSRTLSAWQAGDRDEAGQILIDTFLKAYWEGADENADAPPPAEIGQIDDVELR